MTISPFHMMQPYASIHPKSMFDAPDSPLPPSNISHSRRQSLLSSKRTGLDPPEGGDAQSLKRSREDDPDSMVAAESMILAAQGAPLPVQSVPNMGRGSLYAPFPTFPSGSDAALSLYMAETHAPFGGYYSRASSLPAGPYLASSVFGGLPVPMDFRGMPPSAAAVVALRRRADFLESLAYTQAPLGMSGASGPAVPNLRYSSQMMRQLSVAPLPSTRTDRPSPIMIPRSDSISTSADSELAKMPSLAKKQRLGTDVDDDDNHAHHRNQVCIDISIEQDPNWLSELQCFVRKNLLEVCWANREDVAVRNASKKVCLKQVGIRCRFCAHKPPGSRVQRSSAFPSSIPQIYQSFTMMLRDHFDTCSCIPEDIKQRYLSLKSSTCQGATEAKKYWSYAAAKLGLVDSEQGMIMNDSTIAAAKTIPPFGAVAGEVGVPLGEDGNAVMLVKSSDHDIASGFLYTLMSHFQRIELLPSERKGNRKSLRCGLPGFGCVHCSREGRFGMSRIFPARRRTLLVRVADLYDHIRRCNLCPPDAKIILERLHDHEKQDPSHEKQFLDLVWGRLGHNAGNLE